MVQGGYGVNVMDYGRPVGVCVVVQGGYGGNVMDYGRLVGVWWCRMCYGVNLTD